jgi:hypothetical protein
VLLGMCLVFPVQVFHQTKSGGPAFSGINISYTRKLCTAIQFLFFLSYCLWFPLIQYPSLLAHSM